MDWLSWLLSGVCHQMPEHSLAYQDQVLPLCARCSGMFMGILIALLVQTPKGRRSGLPPMRINVALVVCLFPWAFDGVNSMVSEIMGRPWLYAPYNTMRLITGMLCGLALGVWLYPILHEALWPRSERIAAIERRRDLLPLVLAGGACVAVMLLWLGAPFLLWATLVSVACLTTFWLVNASLVGLIWPIEGVRRMVWPLALRLVMGAWLGFMEMGGMALLREWLMV